MSVVDFKKKDSRKRPPVPIVTKIVGGMRTQCISVDDLDAEYRELYFSGELSRLIESGAVGTVEIR